MLQLDNDTENHEPFECKHKVRRTSDQACKTRWEGKKTPSLNQTFIIATNSKIHTVQSGLATQKPNEADRHSAYYASVIIICHLV